VFDEQQAARIAADLLSAEEITIQSENKKLADFYVRQSVLSLNAARIIEQVSADKETKRHFAFLSRDFEAYLWAVNTAYYSMFYMVNALLASKGIRLRSRIGAHGKIFALLLHHFYYSGRIAKHYIEGFEGLQEESQELLAMERARDMMMRYQSEMDKRVAFTYETGERPKQAKARNSVARAIEFYNECLGIIGREPS